VIFEKGNNKTHGELEVSEDNPCLLGPGLVCLLGVLNNNWLGLWPWLGLGLDLSDDGGSSLSFGCRFVLCAINTNMRKTTQPDHTPRIN